jgi:hypothetical protein
MEQPPAAVPPVPNEFVADKKPLPLEPHTIQQTLSACATAFSTTCRAAVGAPSGAIAFAAGGRSYQKTARLKGQQAEACDYEHFLFAEPIHCIERRLISHQSCFFIELFPGGIKLFSPTLRKSPPDFLCA